MSKREAVEQVETWIQIATRYGVTMERGDFRYDSEMDELTLDGMPVNEWFAAVIYGDENYPEVMFTPETDWHKRTPANGATYPPMGERQG